jgi:ABC-type glutathione transport system ATPase component
MKKKFFVSALLTLALFTFLPLGMTQTLSNDSKTSKKSKEEKEAEQLLVFSRLDSLLNSRQFVFKEVYGAYSDEVFVVVDSGYAMIQNGNRNNLEGNITKFEITKNEKSKNISVTIMMRGAMSNGDIFLIIGSSGSGKATVKSDFPGYFTFDGNVFDFENANIYDGRSHSIH